MTDISSHYTRDARLGRRRSAEFRFYFALIFLLALPFVTIRWARDVIRSKSLNGYGPLARAWCEADRVVPLIFSA